MSAGPIEIFFSMEEEAADILRGDFKRLAEEAELSAIALTRKVRRNRNAVPSCQHYWDEIQLQDAEIRAQVLNALSDEINNALIAARKEARQVKTPEIQAVQIREGSLHVF
jgi:hypothetical protein